MTNTPERRRAARYDLIAQANVASGGEAYLLPVRNISTSGAFLEGSPSEHPDLQPGVEVEVVLSASTPGAKEDEVVNVRCKGRVARVEVGKPPRVGGFGITIEPASAHDAKNLQAIMSGLGHLPPPRPTSLNA
jgi:hypothetical protein